MLPTLANSIIHQLEDGYDRIADHFSDTRSQPWPEFKLLQPYISSATTKLLDVGCGNGRLIDAIPAVHYTGLDLSRQLLNLAQQRYPQYQFIHGSMMQLPFTEAHFDLVACVAALQHIPSVPYRLQAVQELARVLKPGGYLFMLNWNLLAQTHYQQFQAGADYDAGDYLIPWKNDQGTIQTNRYYHGFQLAEIATLVQQASLVMVHNSLGQDDRNLLTIAQKP